MYLCKTKVQLLVFLLGIMCVMIVLTSCGGGSSKKQSSISNGVDIPVMPTDKNSEVTSDSKDTGKGQAILLEIDTNKKTMLMKQLGTKKQTTYIYTGGTSIVNKYDAIMAVSQLLIGQVLDIQYNPATKKLDSIKVADKEWEYTGVTGLKIDAENKTLVAGKEKYSYTDNIVVVCENKVVDISRLDPVDTVTIIGNNKQVDSVIVTSTHGFVRLDSTTYFEGGFVEIGPKIVELIKENMVIPVPVGTYTISVVKDKTSGSKEITVNSNEEIRVNLTEFQSDAVRLGACSFKINPAGAKLVIDGVVKDYSSAIDLAYGKHKVVITADGYEPYAQVIDVEDIFKEYNIYLSEAKGTTGNVEEAEESSNSSKTTTKATTKSNTKSTTKATTTIDYNSLIDSLFGNTNK